MTRETILAIGAGVRAAPTALVAGTGQSFILRAQDASAGCFLTDVSSNFGGASDYQIKSPRMHDNVLGIHVLVQNSTTLNIDLFGTKQKMIQQDNIQVVGGIGGGAATFDNVCFSIWYENIVGAPGNLITWDQCKSRIKNLLTVQCSPAPSAVGNWSVPVVINAINDLFKANTNYAILGVIGADAACTIGVQGPCTGNVILGMNDPMITNVTSSHSLAELSMLTELPQIPVMDSADKGGTFIYVADETSAFTSCNLVLAELEG
jgi:hypothetical protein